MVMRNVRKYPAMSQAGLGRGQAAQDYDVSKRTVEVVKGEIVVLVGNDSRGLFRNQIWKRFQNRNWSRFVY